MPKYQGYEEKLHCQWQDNFQVQDFRYNLFTRDLFQLRDSEIFIQNDEDEESTQKAQQIQNSKIERYENLSKQQIVTSIQQEIPDSKTLKRQHQQMSLQDDQKDSKGDKKQGLYSKVYRQRKKQKFRLLQEQNEYLKKRISELESQLRQQEIQLNRFKFPPPQKQLTVQELNDEMIKVNSGFLEEMKTNPIKYNCRSCITEDHYNTFLESYEQRGFGGKKKIKLLNYHFNQILQSLLKDSQKYLALIYGQSKTYDKLIPLPQFQAINQAYSQICASDQNLQNRLNLFNKFLQPMSLQLNTHISQFYKKFEDILSCQNKIHDFMRDTYLNNNIDIARRRIQMEEWLDFHKYGKMMRKLRYQWFQWMKSLANKQNQDSKGSRKGCKKKKITQ